MEPVNDSLQCVENDIKSRLVSVGKPARLCERCKELLERVGNKAFLSLYCGIDAFHVVVELTSGIGHTLERLLYLVSGRVSLYSHLLKHLIYRDTPESKLLELHGRGFACVLDF